MVPRLRTLGPRCLVRARAKSLAARFYRCLRSFFLPPSLPSSLFPFNLRFHYRPCKCDSAINIHRLYSNAPRSEGHARGFARSTIIISDNYLVFLEPHALSVLKARTELYACGLVRDISALTYCVFVSTSTSRSSDETRRDRDPPFPLPISFYPGRLVYSSLFPQQCDERSELLF